MVVFPVVYSVFSSTFNLVKLKTLTLLMHLTISYTIISSYGCLNKQKDNKSGVGFGDFV